MEFRVEVAIVELGERSREVALARAVAENEYEVPRAIADTGFAALTMIDIASGEELDGAHALEELRRINDTLRESGIEYPLGARGVRDLANFNAGFEERLREEADRHEERRKHEGELNALAQLVREAIEAAVLETPDHMQNVTGLALALADAVQQRQQAPATESVIDYDKVKANTGGRPAVAHLVDASKQGERQ